MYRRKRFVLPQGSVPTPTVAYSRNDNTLPQEVAQEVTPTSTLVFSREDAVYLPALMTSGKELKLRISNNPNKIHASVCICIVMNTDQDLQIISNNLSHLQALFEKSFIVFVVDCNSASVEWCKQYENSVTIEATGEEYVKRNMYLKVVHENKKIFTYMMVLDPQVSLTTKINPDSFRFLKKNIEFSAMFANQTYKYYDIEYLVDEKKQVYSIENLEEKKRKIKQYQAHIPKHTGLIPVKSAFGGFAVYNTSVLDSNNTYTTDNHITFNVTISLAYSKMFIDSSFLIETNPNNSFLYEK